MCKLKHKEKRKLHYEKITKNPNTELYQGTEPVQGAKLK